MSKAEERDVLRVPLAELSPVMLACLEQGQEVILTVTGNSMRPFLRHGKDQVVLVRAVPESLMPGDVPFYRRRDGHFVLHRIVARDDGEHRYVLGEAQPGPSVMPGLHYTLLGDAQTTLEPGIEPDQILARAQAFIVRGKRTECDSPAYRRRTLRWHRLMRYRMKLIFLCMLPERAVRKCRRILTGGSKERADG